LENENVPVLMNGVINTFTIILPIDNELLSLTLCMFCGWPRQNRKKNFTHSIICRIGGMPGTILDSEITADYGRGFILTDCPVVKDDQFIFSNEGLCPVALQIKANIKAIDKTGNIIWALFIVDVKYTLQRFIVSSTRTQHGIKKIPAFRPASHILPIIQ
jgi:hypothetical protein